MASVKSSVSGVYQIASVGFDFTEDLIFDVIDLGRLRLLLSRFLSLRGWVFGGGAGIAFTSNSAGNAMRPINAFGI